MNIVRLYFFILTLVANFVNSEPLSPTNLFFEQLISADDLQAGDKFGWSVSVDGHFAVVGSVLSDGVEEATGVVYVYEKVGDTWQYHQTIESPISISANSFGHSVSIHNNRILIGAPYSNHVGLNTGSAYVFDLVNGIWEQQPVLIADDLLNNSVFGYDVSLFNDVALIGSNGPNRAAYVFNFDGSSWVQSHKFEADAVSGSNSFGYSVSLSENYAVIGDYRDDVNGNDSGAVYVFTKNNNVWDDGTVLRPVTGNPYDNFGYSVSVFGATILIGAPGDSEISNNTGAVYLYDFSNGSWQPHPKVTISQSSDYDRFGQSIALDKNRFVARRDNGIHLFNFHNGQWHANEVVTLPEASEGNDFAWDVTIDDYVVLTGNPGDEIDGVDLGSVAVFMDDLVFKSSF